MNSEHSASAKQMNSLLLSLQDALLHVESLEEIKELKVQFLGKKSQIRQALSQLGALPSDIRKERASEVNALRLQLEHTLEKAESHLVEKSYLHDIETNWMDLTLPGSMSGHGARHPLTRIERFFIERMRKVGYAWVDGPEIETAFRNFDALNIPDHHPARDVQDTFWLENGQLLRSHTSTVQIHALENAKGRLPIRIVAPGKVYRNETVDATHLANFHQFEGMYVDEHVTFAHLLATLEFIVRGIYSEALWEMRVKPKFYPYTEPSIGVDIRARDGGGNWITVLGAGMVHPNVFRALGYDPEKVSGFAFGIGVSRIAAQVTGVTDMKSLYELDLRVHAAVANLVQNLGS